MTAGVHPEGAPGFGGSGEYPDAPEPLGPVPRLTATTPSGSRVPTGHVNQQCPGAVALIDEHWRHLNDDQAIAELAHLLDHHHGAAPAYVNGQDGKRYPASNDSPVVWLVHLLTAHLLDDRRIGLRELARRIGRSHCTLRRWRTAGWDVVIVGTTA